MEDTTLSPADHSRQTSLALSENPTLGIPTVEAPQLHGAPQEKDLYGIVMFDEQNPRALVNIVPGEIKKSMNRVAMSRPELLEMDEVSLKKLLSPNATDSRIRISFWNEYQRAQDQGVLMKMPNVYAGLCSDQYFYGVYVKSVEKFGWILCPPASYAVSMTEALHFGVERLREILELPLLNDKGQTNKTNVEMIIKAVAMLDMRVKGAVVQKIESKTMNVHVSDRKKTYLEQKRSVEEIRLSIRDIEKKLETNSLPFADKVEEGSEQSE